MWNLIVSVPDHCLSFYFKSLIKFLFVFFEYKCIKSILFTFYPTATDVGINCGMAVRFVGMLFWMFFLFFFLWGNWES